MISIAIELQSNSVSQAMNLFYARPVIPLLIAGITGIYVGADFPGYLLWAAGITLLSTGMMIEIILETSSVLSLWIAPAATRTVARQ